MTPFFQRTVGKYGPVRFVQPDSCHAPSGQKGKFYFIMLDGVVHVLGRLRTDRLKKRGKNEHLVLMKTVEYVVLKPRKNERWKKLVQSSKSK